MNKKLEAMTLDELMNAEVTFEGKRERFGSMSPKRFGRWLKDTKVAAKRLWDEEVKANRKKHGDDADSGIFRFSEIEESFLERTDEGVQAYCLINSNYMFAEIDEGFHFDCVENDDQDALSIAHPLPIKDPGRVMDGSVVYIRFSYPLKRPVVIEFKVEGGRPCTTGDFAGFVVAGYRRIYAEEERSMSGDPGRMAPGLLNRGTSDGVHGIWGHDIDDLHLEGVEKGKDGVWELHIGS